MKKIMSLVHTSKSPFLFWRGDLGAVGRCREVVFRKDVHY